MRFLEQIALFSRPLSQFLDGESCRLPKPYHDTFGTCVDESSCEGFVTSGLCSTPVGAIKCCTDTFAPYNGEAGSPGDLSLSGINFIHAFEGFVEHFYCDKVRPIQTPPLGARGPCRHALGEGTLTIGWGHSCESHDCSGLDDTITQEKGDQLFASDVADIVRIMNAQLDPNLFLTQNQFDALCSFGYNGGPARFNHIVGFINDGHYNAAFEYMKTIAGSPLVKQRRYMEINLFNS